MAVTSVINIKIYATTINVHRLYIPIKYKVDELSLTQRITNYYYMKAGILRHFSPEFAI